MAWQAESPLFVAKYLQVKFRALVQCKESKSKPSDYNFILGL